MRRALALALLLGAGPGAVAAEAPRVATKLGEYVGEEVKGVHLFSRIAYAKPPVGPRRWRHSEPETVARQAKERYACPQFVNDSLPIEPLPMQEDCLYMNVWKPKRAAPGAKLPVLFLIHGGGLLSGSGLKEFYDGSIFAREDVVFVAFNYRLGELGYGPRLDPRPGSLGLMDQALALRWVKQHIDRFGGDPQRIFLVGHSKGGEAVAALMQSGEADAQVAGGVALSGARDFSPEANRFIPAEQRVFAPGERDWPWERVMRKRDFYVYTPEMPRVLTKREDGHKFQLVVSILYGESFGPQPSFLYCADAGFLSRYPDYIEGYYYLWHPGRYNHGDEMVSLFRQDSFGKTMLAFLLHFLRDGKPPRTLLGGEPRPFRTSQQVYHVYPWFTLRDTFAGTWNWDKTECVDQKKFPGSVINEKFVRLERLLKIVGPPAFARAPFPPAQEPLATVDAPAPTNATPGKH